MTVPLLTAFRRRLASGALALTLLQLALLFAVPVSACCVPAGADHAPSRPAQKVECCPAGTHPPGQCPLHRASQAAETKADARCRMTCDAPHGPQFLLGAIGVLPLPESIEIDLSRYALHAAVPHAVTARPSLPDAPPPRV